MIVSVRKTSSVRPVKGEVETLKNGLHFFSPAGRVGVQVIYDPEEPLQSSFSISHNDIDYSNFATDRIEYGDDLYLKTSLTAMENSYCVDVKGEKVCVTGKTSDVGDEIEGFFSYSQIANAGGLTLDSADCKLAFAYCTQLTVAPIITKDVTSLNQTFRGCTNLKYVDISALDSATLANVNFTGICTDCYPDGWLKVAPDTTKAQLEALDDEIPDDWIIFGFDYNEIESFTAHAHETYMDCDLSLYNRMATEVIEWEISTDPTFGKVIDGGTWNVNSSVENQFVNDGLTVNTIYYVRVRIAFADGTYGSWVTSSAITRYNYFSITNPSDAERDLTVTLTMYGGKSNFDYEISTDNENWETWIGGSSVMRATVGIGDTIYLRGDNTGTRSTSIYAKFGFNGDATFGGSLTAIRRKEYNDDSLGDYQFYRLFYGCRTITAAPILYSIGSFGNYCYNQMFRGCTGLTSAPALPATTLADYCYTDMFYGCTSLTSAPALPATTLADYCYTDMFYGCTSLASAPALPATTLSVGCYKSMFKGCTSLASAPALPATTLSQACYYEMFNGCTSLTAAPALPATTLAVGCYAAMFYGCTGLTSAPALPATTLAQNCYGTMFYGCTGLTSAPALPATTLAQNCYYGMFYGCTGLTAAPALPATTLDERCYESMFDRCTALTAAPVLPATTLTTRCYANMFYRCTSLTSVPADLLPSDVTDPTVGETLPALSQMLQNIGASSLPTELSTIITGLGYTLSDVYTKATE